MWLWKSEKLWIKTLLEELVATHASDEKRADAFGVEMCIRDRINRLQESVDAISFDLKEPMEVWRTTKYGARAASMIVTFVRWVVPIGAAALIGYNAWQAKILTEIRAEIPQSSVSTTKPGEK